MEKCDENDTRSATERNAFILSHEFVSRYQLFGTTSDDFIDLPDIP